MKNIVISTLITLVLVSATYLLLGYHVKQNIGNTQEYVVEFKKTKQNLLARINALEVENEELRLENDGIFQTVLQTERAIKTLVNFAELSEAEQESLALSLAELQTQLTQLENTTTASVLNLATQLELLQTKPSEATQEPEIEAPYVVSNEVEKVVAEPVACPKPVKNRSFSYYIRNVTLKNSVAFRIVYDLAEGKPVNVEFESNPPSSIRRASVRYLSSLDFGTATAENCSIPFKINV
jgi:hypothetical protein|tara:strand:+ start:820 stop:1536 length:717 start_codon:yes stop_codon:yes gene_type:complete